METWVEEFWPERPMLSFLDRNNTHRRNRSEEVEIEDSEQIPKEELICKRRNAICEVLMPREYFSSLRHLELMNMLSEAGLV